MVNAVTISTLVSPYDESLTGGSGTLDTGHWTLSDSMVGDCVQGIFIEISVSNILISLDSYHKICYVFELYSMEYTRFMINRQILRALELLFLSQDICNVSQIYFPVVELLVIR